MRKLACFLMMLALLSSCDGNQESQATGSAPVDTLRILVNRIQRCSKLYTTEFQIRKIITHNDELRLKGSVLGYSVNMPMPASDRNIAIPIDATVKGYIDFSQFSRESVRKHGDQIEIILPDPEVELTSTKIDRKSVSEHVSWFRSDFSDKELTLYERKGREMILKSINDLDIAERARLSATRMLIPIINMLGYDENNIVITFRKDLDSQQLRIISPVN